MINAVEPYRHLFDLNNPTRIIFGPGALKTLHEYPMPGKKALICLDKDPFAEKMGYLATLTHELELAGCEYAIFNKIQPNPILSTVHEGRDYLKEQGCDFLVSLGGGGPCDTAKAIAVVATNPGSLWDYIPGGSGGRKVPEIEPLPLISIPTTAGTGSEVAPGMVITNDVTGEKNSFKSWKSFPVYCFADPEIQTSVPPRLTAFQGYDAMTHCVEGYLMTKSTLMSDMFTLAAVENAYRFLPRAVRNGKDIEARERIAFTAMLTGWCMNTASTSTMHPLEHTLSEFNPKIAHGEGLIMISQAYHRHQISVHAADDRYVELARAMGRPNATRPEEFLEAHADFLKMINCDNLKMSDYGITPEHFPDFVKSARYATPAMFTTQDRVPLTDADIIKIFTESYK